MSKISKTLMLYFTTILIIFSLIMTLSFMRLNSKNIIEANKDMLLNNAKQIASNLADYLEESNTKRSHGMGMSHQMGRRNELNSFVKIVDQISYGEVWLVDKDKTIITNSMHSSDNITEEISNEGVDLIEQALMGKSGYSESFTLNTRMMAVSVPSVNKNGEIVAAVLLLVPIQDRNLVISEGFQNLVFSGLIAMGLSFIIAWILSRKFVRPITKINDTTKMIANEDYTVKTNIDTDDEIGELAHSIDILSDRLMVAKEQRERYDQERKEFYVEISHELRTPVTVLKGSLELLSDDKVETKEKQNEYHKQMLVEINYLQNMLNDLLDYSKLNNDDVELITEMVNVSDILSDALRGMRRVAEVKNITINYENNTEGIPLLGNYEKLRQMFIIVLDNAIKYSYEASKIDVIVNETSGIYFVVIQDYGQGIKEEDLPHIFDRYYKDDRKNGTGIGLALSKKIALRHNIEIGVTSDTGKTTFTFEISK